MTNTIISIKVEFMQMAETMGVEIRPLTPEDPNSPLGIFVQCCQRFIGLVMELQTGSTEEIGQLIEREGLRHWNREHRGESNNNLWQTIQNGYNI